MRRVLWLVGSGILALAVLVAFRGTAAASDTSADCTQVDGFLSFCLNVPTGGVRRETTVPLVVLPSQRADVRVEVTVPGSDALAVAAGVDRSVERVETLFGRTFNARPRVLLFGTNDSFATGAAQLFGYSSDTAAYVASTYGGIFDRGTSTIAVNWASAGHDRMSAAIEHELTHLMIREVTRGNDIPVWLDEGIATLVEEGAPGAAAWNDGADLTGRAIAASHTVAFAQLSTLADFHASYARVGRPLYEFTADAVRTMEQRISWSGVVRTLDAVGSGYPFEVAYRSVSGESVDALEARLGATASAITIGAADAKGNVTWTLVTGAPLSEVRVRIAGGASYSLTFTVTTDAFGIYRGSFGSTAAPGAYVVSAAGATASFSTVR
ncbi:MAG TPA: hypothetical protein VEU77_12100 [Candidatus Acidoferrales bacterium]|nr:hypothetical protein [Candidatus Acidoferrales bacterium]